MAFEKFTAVKSRPTKPSASIRNHGKIGFNRHAVRAFGMAAFTHVVLYFDAERRMVGVELTNDDTAPGATLLCQMASGKDVYLNAKAFCDYYGVRYSVQTVHSPIHKSRDKADFFCFRVRAPQKS